MLATEKKRISKWPFVAVRVGAALLLVWAIAPNPYPYYVLLRFVVCGVCGYTAYRYSQAGSTIFAWIFSGLAVLFNPFLPIYLASELWMPIDLVAASILLWSASRYGFEKTVGHFSASGDPMSKGKTRTQSGNVREPSDGTSDDASPSKSESVSQSGNVTETSDETSGDDSSELLELITTKQLRTYALSNLDLWSAFSKVLEASDSAGEMGQRTFDFVAQAARIAGRPIPKSLHETVDFLEEQAREARPDPKLMGDLLSYSWLNGRFQSDVSELCGELKPEIQGLAKGWLQVWWLYLSRIYVAGKCGNDFASTMMDQVHQKFRKLSELDRNFRGLSGMVDTWVTDLDDAIWKFKDVPLGEEEAPAEYIAALCFLMKDHESPFYRQSKIDDDVDTKVALALVKMREKLTEWLDFYI